ncbi:MAG: cupin domain-containing protein [Ilumatobacteraceae bacterium]|nr:cupin domain-containing protein [Ilumatobacteraceae bacterium]
MSIDPTTIDPGNATDLHWFDGMLMDVKLPATETEGRISLCEQFHANGYGTPVHVHEREDQTLYVLAGSITAWLDPNGDLGDTTELQLSEGDTVFLPRQVPHAFRVDAEGTRLLEINTPGGFERFHIEAGQPTTERRLPDPQAPDIENLVRVGADYGCEILGPPVGAPTGA